MLRGVLGNVLHADAVPVRPCSHAARGAGRHRDGSPLVSVVTAELRPTGAGQVISRSGLAAYFARDLIRSAARMLLRRVRTRERVRAEYDAGHWRRVLEQQTWAETPDLRTFLIGNDATPIIAKVDGRV